MSSASEQLRKEIGELGNKYWEGRENFIIRYWTYLDRGLEVFNKFKYYIGFPLAAGAFIPFLEDKISWLIILTILGLPVLILVGRYQLQKISKTAEYVNAMTGSIFQFKGMELTIEQITLLKEIKSLLEQLNAKNNH